MSKTNVPAGLWRKASYSNGQGSGAEAGQAGPAVAVRDTKDRHGPALAFSPAGGGSSPGVSRRAADGPKGGHRGHIEPA